MLKDKLEIIIITYNRKKYLQRTLEKLLEENSPVKNCQITVLDNNSTDATSEYAEEFAKAHNNVVHIKNKYNVGGDANFVKAVELVNKEYFWILGDDDLYDWSNWQEVENAIENDNDMIFLMNEQYENEVKNICKNFPKLKKTKNIDITKKAILTAYFVFIFSAIYKKSLVDDNVMKNMYDMVCTKCPQAALFCKVLNENKSLYILKNKEIVKYGYDENVDVSYTRGYEKTELYPRSYKMTFYVGFIGALELLKDKKLKKAAAEYTLRYNKCGKNIYKIVKSDLRLYNKTPYNIADVLLLFPMYYKLRIILELLPCAIRMVVDKISQNRKKKC